MCAPFSQRHHVIEIQRLPRDGQATQVTHQAISAQDALVTHARFDAGLLLSCASSRLRVPEVQRRQLRMVPYPLAGTFDRLRRMGCGIGRRIVASGRSVRTTFSLVLAQMIPMGLSPALSRLSHGGTIPTVVRLGGALMGLTMRRIVSPCRSYPFGAVLQVVRMLLHAKPLTMVSLIVPQVGMLARTAFPLALIEVRTRLRQAAGGTHFGRGRAVHALTIRLAGG